jgi:MYXO-CTERM domain-containing protein
MRWPSGDASTPPRMQGPRRTLRAHPPRDPPGPFAVASAAVKRALLTSLLLAAGPASAVDVWTTPYPGVRLLRRTTGLPSVTWVAVVDSCAPGIRFRVTEPAQGRRTVSSFGRLVGAQLAINGDFFDHDFGLNVGNGMRWPPPDTDTSGNFSVGPGRLEMTPDHVILPAPYPWVTEQLGGRWTLLDDGVAQRGIDDNGPAPGGFVCAPGLRHPRTAIGLSRDRQSVFLLVADGRSGASAGLTCDEMIDLFVELGAHDAMGLDGGGSSTLWTSAAGVVNRPSDGAERVVGNHLAVFATGSGAAPHCGRRPVVTEPALARAVPDAPRPRVAPLAAPARYRPLTPTRLFDTRSAAESARLLRGDGSSAGPLALASGGGYRDWAAVGVSADATAVWLNVAAIGLQAPGFLSVLPHGRPRPGTSNVNYEPARIIANAVPVALGDLAQVDLLATAAVDAVVDVKGSFGPTGAGLLPVTPTRVLDTRSPAMPLRAGVARRVAVRGPAEATGVVASVAVIAGSAAGFVTASPCGGPLPQASHINFAPGDIVANTIAAELTAGQLCLTASADADVVVDVTGYLAPRAPLAYVPIAPERLLDTRRDDTPFAGRAGERQVLSLPIQALAGMPAAVGAAVVNLTVTDAAAPGFVTAFPCGSPPPEASTLNFPAARAVGGLGVIALGDGSLCLFSNVRAHVVVDLLGVWVAAPTPALDAGIAPPDAPGNAPQDADAEPRPDGTAPASDAARVDGPLDAEPRDPLVEGPRPGCGCATPTRPRGRTALALAALAALAGRRRRRPSPLDGDVDQGR